MWYGGGRSNINLDFLFCLLRQVKDKKKKTMSKIKNPQKKDFLDGLS